MSDTAPQTNRPETAADLRYQWQVTDREVCAEPRLVSKDVARWWGNTLAAAADVPEFAIKTNGRIVHPVSDEEKADLVEGERGSYDRGREKYQTYLDTGEIPRWNHEWSTYLDYEELPTPEKPEDTDDE